MELFSLFGTIGLKGADSVKGDLDDITRKAHETESKSKGSFSKFGNSMKAAVPASGALLGVVTGVAVGVGALGVSFFKAGEEAAQSNQRIESIYSSMGNGSKASKKAASDTIKYAETLAMQIGVDDDIIKQGQAKLATFSAVTRTQETMNRTTKLAADMAAAGFGEMSSTSIQLGKALQDPVKGISALGKSGVTFSEQEKETIKKMYEAGDAAGYQEIMFKAVEKQVGGTAEATATTSGKMALAFDNVKESIGQAIKPIFDAVLPAIVAMSDKVQVFFAGDWQGKLAQLAPVFMIVGGAILAGIVPALVAMATAAWAAITPLLPFMAIGAAIGAAIYLVVQYLGGFSAAWGKLKAAFAVVWSYLKPAWLQLKGFAIQTFVGIKSSIVNNMDLIKGTITKVMGVIKAIWLQVWNVIKAVVPPLWNAIKAAITTTINTIKGVIKAVMQAINGDWKGAWETVKKTFMGLIKGFVTVAKNLAKAVIDGLIAGLKGGATLVLNALKGIVKGAIDAAKAVLGIKSPSRVFKGIGKNVVEGFAIGIDTTADKVKTSMNSLIEKVMTQVEKLPKSTKKSTKEWAKEVAAATAKYIKANDNALIKLAKTSEKVQEKLKKAKDALADIKKRAVDFANSVAGGISASISNLFKEGNTAADFAKSLQDRLVAARNFQVALDNLKTRGLSTQILGDLAQMGVEQGLEAAQALASATPEMIAEINATNAELESVAADTGNNMAGALFTAGINAAQGLVNGLVAQEAKIIKQMERLADKMVKAIKDKLKIKSPSQVFEYIGNMLGEGLEVGGVSSINTAQGAIGDEINGLMGSSASAVNVKQSANRNAELVELVNRQNKSETLLAELLNVTKLYLPQMANMQMVTDTGALVGALAPQMDGQLGRIYDKRKRGSA